MPHETGDRATLLQDALAAASWSSGAAQERISVLEAHFNRILERFNPPAFGEQPDSQIDRRTYLPLFHGRRFEDLSSPGLATLVSVAYALAQQRAALELGLKLPNILLIDGLSEHWGQEGLDPDRRVAVYEYLMNMSDELGDELQLIVVDNEVQQSARRFVRLELSESERLVPSTP